ncbi:MAG TPA: amidohydrolase [Acidimicrobiia bacterium]
MVSPADLILHSGKLWDGRAIDGGQALAVAGGKILAAGANHEVERHRSEHTRSIDVDGRRIMPGLIDSHIHMVRGGLRWNVDPRWHDLSSLSEGLDRLARAGEGRDRAEWVAVAGGWNPDQFTEKRAPTRRELDEASPEHPVFVQRNYIEAFVNTRALESMGWIGAGAPDWVEHDPESGEPTGRVVGVAALQALGQQLSPPSDQEQVDGTRAMLRELNRVGLTGAIDAGGFRMTPEAYRPITDLYRNGEGGFRARLLVGASQPGDEAGELERWMGMVSPGSGDELLRYLGAGEVVLFPAHDMEGLDQRDITGETGRLTEISRKLVDAGWPLHIHAILDRSVGTILDAWEQLGRDDDLADLRFTITHADQAGVENLQRIRDIGVGLSVQNGMAFRGRDSIASWGEDLVRRSPPLRTMVDLGIPLGAGTDGTVVSSYNPWACIWWMVSGENRDGSPTRVEEQRLTRDEALRLYTRGSAWFSFEEDTRGNLRVGSDADLVVLSADPLTVPEHDIPNIESVLTVVGGRIAHVSGFPIGADL